MTDKTLAHLAIARLAIGALTLYVQDTEGELPPPMSLLEIANAILDALNAAEHPL